MFNRGWGPKQEPCESTSRLSELFLKQNDFTRIERLADPLEVKPGISCWGVYPTVKISSIREIDDFGILAGATRRPLANAVTLAR